MRRTLEFAKRNFKELLRDPFSLIFSFALPLFLLFIFQQFDIPSEVYDIENFAPGIIIFSYGFLTLFTAQLIAKDRTSSLLTRLYASPLKSREFVIGYTLSLIPFSILQSIIFFFVSILLGLTFSFNILLTILVLIPISILFIAFGILIGCGVNDKAAPGVSSIIVQLIAFTSGMWFDVEMVGSVIEIISKILPFSHTLNLTKAVLLGGQTDLLTPILIVLIYTLIVYLLSFIVFKRKMISDNK